MKLKLSKHIANFKWAMILLASMSLTVPVYSHNQEEENDCETPPNPPPDDCDDCKEKDDCGKCLDQTKGDPFLLSNGKFMQNMEFLKLSGPLNMRIRLFFDDWFDYPSQVGQNWSLNYVWRLYLSDSLNAPYVIRTGQGYRVKYEPLSGNQYVSVNNKNNILTINVDGTAVMEIKEGVQYHFDTLGRLSTVKDGKGAELRITYVDDDKHAIIGLTEFTNVETPMVIARDYQLSRVEEYYGGVSSGRYFDFSYDTSGHIFQIQDQASRTLLFSYSSAGELLTVQGPEGNLYQYSYENIGEIKTFSTTGCLGENCLPVVNYYDVRGRLTNQVVGANGEGDEYIVDYPNSSHNDTILYTKIKDDLGGVIHTREERYTFGVDDYQDTFLKRRQFKWEMDRLRKRSIGMMIMGGERKRSLTLPRPIHLPMIQVGA